MNKYLKSIEYLRTTEIDGINYVKRFSLYHIVKSRIQYYFIIMTPKWIEKLTKPFLIDWVQED